ncbi:cytochrome c biogenesis CcdA family protein [Patescibacteria group bacterium]
MNKPKLKILLLIFFITICLFSANLGMAQEADSTCPLEEPNCTEQGLQLATLLENRGLSFSLIVVAGLLDGVNPCAIGMLILLLGYLLVFVHEPKRMVKIGLIYIATVFITYFLIGIVFSQLVYKLLDWHLYQQVSHIIKYVIVGLIWLAALINLKDVFFYGKWFSLGVTKKEVPVLMKLIKKVDWPTTILLGFVVTIFELPCSLPLYVGSIAIMTETFSYFRTIGYLLVYNLMFILPLFIVFAFLVKTHHIFEAKDVQERANKWMKLSMAIAQIIIGIGLLLI